MGHETRRICPGLAFSLQLSMATATGMCMAAPDCFT